LNAFLPGLWSAFVTLITLKIFRFFCINFPPVSRYYRFGRSFPGQGTDATKKCRHRQSPGKQKTWVHFLITRWPCAPSRQPGREASRRIDAGGAPMVGPQGAITMKIRPRRNTKASQQRKAATHWSNTPLGLRVIENSTRVASVTTRHAYYARTRKCL